MPHPVVMFDINPDRPADNSPRQPREPMRMPLSTPPPAPTSWWKTIPGQLALVVILGGALVIALGLMGVLGPLSQR